MNTLKRGSYFFVPSFWRNICLLIIIGLVCSSSNQPELKPLPGDYSSQSHLSYRVDADHLIKQLNDPISNSYMWLICGFSSWEDLKIYLPEAKMAGLSVWAILIPPYLSPAVNPDCTYSEPFGDDYILWAKEIAKLSLRYSNLIGYGIDNFQENIDLGYFTQTYIDNILTTGNSINPLLQFISNEATTLPNIYYVDRNATGDGSGSDWTNASTSISALDWGLIAGGDTIYVSGGIDSTVYGKEILIDYVITGGILTITNGLDAGHNGRAIFKQSGVPEDPKASFYLKRCQNIKITGLKFSTAVSDAYNGRSILKIKQCENVIIDNNVIYSNGNGTAVTINGNPDDPSRKLIITNNYIEVGSHPLEDYPKDCMWIGNNHGGHTITGNTFITHAIWSDEQHPDIIQMYREGSDDNLQMTIANNFMMYDNNTTSNAQSIYMEDMGSNRILYYNNIIVMNAIKNRGFVCDGINDSVNLSIRAFNNTHIKDGPSSTLFWATNIDTLIMKNNIFYSDSIVHSMILMGIDSLNEIDYIDVDYNHYYTSEGLEGSNLYRSKWGSSLSWTEWQALGYDANGDTGSVSFVNLWDSTITAYELTTGSDTGTDLSSIFTTDIRGIIRPQGVAWDKGAVEFEGVVPVELVSFTAVIKNNNTILLKWETATEINNYGFEIERTTENSDWFTIGFVEGHGNSNSPKQYTFLDSVIYKSVNYYYRLKQIDNDGTFEYSDVITIPISVPDNYHLGQNFANPFNPSTVINYMIPKESKVVLKVYDILSKEISTLVNENKPAGSYSVTFNAGSLPSGIYVYELKTGGFVFRNKMMLIK